MPDDSSDDLPRLPTLAEVHNAAMAGTLVPDYQADTAEPVVDLLRRWPHLLSSNNPEVLRIVKQLKAASQTWPVFVQDILLRAVESWARGKNLRLRGQPDVRKAMRRRQTDLANEVMKRVGLVLKRLDAGALLQEVKEERDYTLTLIDVISTEVPEVLLWSARSWINTLNEWLVANHQKGVSNRLLAGLVWIASGTFDDEESKDKDRDSESTIRSFLATPRSQNPPAARILNDPNNREQIRELLKRVPGPRSDKSRQEIVARLHRLH